MRCTGDGLHDVYKTCKHHVNTTSDCQDKDLCNGSRDIELCNCSLDEDLCYGLLDEELW